MQDDCRKESPKPSRCNFAWHAIQIDTAQATKKITKTKLQTATKRRERKATRRKSQNELCSKSCSDKFSSFRFAAFHIYNHINFEFSMVPQKKTLSSSWLLFFLLPKNQQWELRLMRSSRNAFCTMQCIFSTKSSQTSKKSREPEHHVKF